MDPAIRAPLWSTLASSSAGCTNSWPSCSASHAIGPAERRDSTTSPPAPPSESGKSPRADDAFAQRLAQDQLDVQIGSSQRITSAGGSRPGSDRDLAAHVAEPRAHADHGVAARQQFHVLALERAELADAIDGHFGLVVGGEREAHRSLGGRHEIAKLRDLARQHRARVRYRARLRDRRARGAAHVGREHAAPAARDRR